MWIMCTDSVFGNTMKEEKEWFRWCCGGTSGTLDKKIDTNYQQRRSGSAANKQKPERTSGWWH